MELLTSIYGMFSGELFREAIVGLVVLVCILGFLGAPFWVWTTGIGIALWGFGAATWAWWIFCMITLIFNLRPVRRTLLSTTIMKIVKARNFFPVISETEQTAIEAGTVWVEGELFCGKPDFKRINNEPYPNLTEEEQAFLDGPVENLCDLVNDWDAHVNKDLPEEAWAYIKKQRFFGMIIPKEYDGLGFSVAAHSAVIGKLASRSIALSTTVMVPNSIGPAELLMHYGTDQQKKHYLPRLAHGEEIPCFALTEPNAGSDAGSIRSSGVVFKGEDGALYIRLNWEKRYITLAAVSTIIGLAFKLKDPENFLGKGQNPGITCALVPSNAQGVILGKRHDPLGVPFHNAPTEGHDVVVAAESIIGGIEGAGNGWSMLMESLAAGRGISLPAASTVGAQLIARIAGAHATVRKQFGLSIGRFEGIEDVLARLGGLVYIMEAARTYTCGGLDSGARPAVATAIMKYNMTELYRKVVNDGMDILGGNAISKGPRNLLAAHHIGAPIFITVEGANILTRTLIIFGQGAIRCHPYAYREIQALNAGDTTEFDRTFWSHAGHVVRNFFRTLLLTLTRGYLASSPVSGPTARYYRKLAWASASFALFADLTMGVLGGQLKRREKITGRFADIFSWLYLGSATLRRFEAEGRSNADLPILHWSMQYALTQIQEGFEGLFQNLKLPGLYGLFRGPITLLWRINRMGRMPLDILGAQVASILQKPGPQRDALTPGIYLPKNAEEPLVQLEHALQITCESEAIERRLRDAVRSGQLPKERPEQILARALEMSLINPEEATVLQTAEKARNKAIQVDSFTLEEFGTKTPGGLISADIK